MKKKDLQETRSKDLEKLKKEVEERKFAISKAMAEIKGSKEKNLKKVRNLRIDLSQVLTIVREKEIIAESKKIPSLSSEDGLVSGMSSSLKGNTNRKIGEDVMEKDKNKGKEDEK